MEESHVNKKSKFSRILATLLVLALMFGMLPFTLGAGFGEDDFLPDEADAAEIEELFLEEFDISQYDVSGINGALLSKNGLKASSALTKASDLAAIEAEEISYVEAVAEELTEPVGIIDIEGEDDETFHVFVWLQNLPDALERVYTRERMNVRGYERARSDGHRARGEIRNRHGSSITHEYFEVFSGYALEVTMAEINELSEMDGVFAITEVAIYFMDEYTPDPEYQTPGNAGAREVFDLHKLHEMGIDGTGVKVGVIDSGIDPNHPDLQGAYMGGWYYPGNHNRMGTPDGSHGTHVAGTIASQGIVSLGMAPGVELYMAQVFNPAQSNQATEANINAAIDDFARGNAARGIPKVDIVNMSVGNNVDSPYSAGHFARNNACIAGTLIVNSAGNNAYPATAVNQRNGYTLGSGGVSLPISVAASEYGGNPILAYTPTVLNDAKVGEFNFYCENGDASLAALEGLFRDGAFGSEETRFVTYGPIAAADAVFAHPLRTYEINPLVYIEGKGYELFYACPNNVPSPGGTMASEMTLAEITALNNMPMGSLDGKILVVNRGQPFIEYKVQALRLGAAALIILNRDEAVIGNLNIGAETKAEDLLIFSAPASVKQIMYDAVQDGKIAYLDPGPLSNAPQKNQPAGFSSMGPVNATAELKPDIIAPGWAVLSTSIIQATNAAGAPVSPYTILGSTYTEMSGTSMSSPCVAGIAALVKQQYPDATPAEIKARLMNTADPYVLVPSATNNRNDFSYYFNAAGTEVSVFEQGAGFVDPVRAVLGGDVFITVDAVVPTGNTNQGTMRAAMASFSFGQKSAGMTTDPLTATVFNADDYSLSVIYRNDTRYSVSSEGAVEVFWEKGEDNTFDVWLEIGEDVSNSAYLGNLYEGFVVVTVDEEEFLLPWAVRIGAAVPGGEWIMFPDRPIQAMHNVPAGQQDFAPYSSRNVHYVSFKGKGMADQVVLRSSGLLTMTYFLDIYLINAETNQPAYRYQITLGTRSLLELLLGTPKLSDFIQTDGTMYRFQAPAQAYARTTGTTYQTTLSNITAGDYYVALQFNRGSGNIFDYYEEAGVTFTNERPTLTVGEVLDADAETAHPYGYGTEEVTVAGQMYSKAIEKAAEAGFVWCGYYLLAYDAVIPLDQSLNVLIDAETGAELEFFSEDFGEEVPWFADEDGYFELTLPVNEDDLFFGDLTETGSVYVADAFDVSGPWDIAGTVVTYYNFMYYGCMASFLWTPTTFEDDPEIEVISATLNNVAGTLTAQFLFQDGVIPEELDEDLLSAVLTVDGVEADVLVFAGYDADTGVATWTFAPYKVASFTPLQLEATVTYEQFWITTSATATDVSIHLVKAALDALVDKLNGNKNGLHLWVRETYSDGTAGETYYLYLLIDNNAEGNYKVGPYTIYCNTKGNTQIRDLKAIIVP